MDLDVTVEEFLRKAKFRKELEQLRTIVLDCGLNEEVKWGQPCYTYHKKNVLILGEFKAHCIISFFKGALMSDEKNIMVQPGSVQAARFIPFVNAKDISKNESILKAYIYEAIEIEKAGMKVRLKKTSEYEVPQELEDKLKKSASFKKAFNALTPGRQRGYIVHFSEPKKSETRAARIEKCTSKILKGEGLHDDYKK
ncbi:MAG: YdeI/OmpD-associated family protein [Bacteroidota bacterium]